MQLVSLLVNSATCTAQHGSFLLFRSILLSLKPVTASFLLHSSGGNCPSHRGCYGFRVFGLCNTRDEDYLHVIPVDLKDLQNNYLLQMLIILLLLFAKVKVLSPVPPTMLPLMSPLPSMKLSLPLPQIKFWILS